LPENGQPTKEEWDEMEKNLGRQRLEKDYRWEVATLKVNANVNFSWPRSLELLTKARKIAPSPVLPDHDAATKAEKLQVLRDFFMEPIQDAIQDVTAGRIWVQIYRDVNWITDKISEKLASRLSNPINRAGLLAVDELRQFISFRVTVTIVLPEALALSLPRVQAAKYEADAVRATADGEEYKRIREGKGSAEALRFAYEVKERHPSVVAAEAIEKSQGTHVGVTSYMLNELNKMFGRGYGRPERRDNR
jgi:hypothetical protein